MTGFTTPGEFGINPPNMDAVQQSRYEDFQKLLETFGGEEGFQQALTNVLEGVKNYNSKLYQGGLRDKLSINEDQFYEKYYGTSEYDKLEMYQSNIVKDRMYELYLPGIKRGENQILDEMINSLYNNPEHQTNAWRMAQDQFRRLDDEDYAHKARIYNDKYGGYSIVPTIFNLAFAAMTFSGSGGTFTFYPGESDPGFQDDFSNPESNIPTGFGEDYAKGPDMVYDPETGYVGPTDPDGGIPGYEDGEYVGPEIPDFTRPDPVKGIEDFSPVNEEDLGEFSGSLDQTGSFSEYSYSQFEEAGQVQSKLGNFSPVTEFSKVNETKESSEATLVSDWVENMPNMPKAASFLYPKS